LENGRSKIVIAQPSSIKKQERHINLLLLQSVDEREDSEPENSGIT
jgi:hypothetical protein